MKAQILSEGTDFKKSLVVLFVLLRALSAQSQCVNSYQLNFSDPTTYSVTCGSVNPAQWSVKNDSCILLTPRILVGGIPGTENNRVDVNIKINQSGNLTVNDFAWIEYIVNNSVARTFIVRGDTVSAVFTRKDTILVPSAGNLEIRITLKTTANNRFFQIKNGDISGCVISGENNPMSVQLIDFTGILSGNTTKLSWKTASELNNAFFLLERSEDGQVYNELAEVAGSGTTQTKSTYHYYDENPLKGRSYYRLSQTDFNGKTSVISVITLMNLFKQTSLTIYPNPSAGNDIQLRFEGHEEKNVLITVVNLKGNVIYSNMIELDSQGKAVLDTGLIRISKPGIYTLKGKMRDSQFYDKLIIP